MPISTLEIEPHAGEHSCQRCGTADGEHWAVRVTTRGPRHAVLCKKCTDLARMGDIGVLASVMTIQKGRHDCC